MSRVSSTNPVLDLMAAAMQQKMSKDIEPGSDFRAMFNNALGTGSQPQSAQTQTPQYDIGTREAEKTRPSERTETGRSQDRPKQAEVSDSQNAEADSAVAAAAVIANVVVAQDAPQPEAEAEAGNVVTVEPPASQMTTGPIVQVTTSPIQYAQQIAELMQAQPEVQEEADDPFSMIEKVEVTMPQSEADDVNMGTINLPKFVIADEAQYRFDNLMEQATRELSGKGAAATSRENPVPEELQATIPDEDVALRDLPETIRAIEKNISGAMRDQREVLPAPKPINEEAVPTAQQPVIQQQPERAPTTQPVFQPQEVYVPRTVEQVHVEVVRNLELQNMQFRMQLNPRELGPLDIRMVMDTGRVTVEIIASSARTADLLSRGIDSIVASLRISGIDVQNVVVTPTEAQSSHLDRGHDMAGQGANDGQQGQNSKGQPGKDADGSMDGQSSDDEQHAPEKLLDRAV